MWILTDWEEARDKTISILIASWCRVSIMVCTVFFISVLFMDCQDNWAQKTVPDLTALLRFAAADQSMSH